MPRVEIRFDLSIDFLETTGVPKGGGSEVLGTFSRTLYRSDGMKGVASVVLDGAKRSTFAGGTGPPNVAGFGLEGASELCMGIAKEAAVLCPGDDRHPEARIADLERRPLSTIDESHIGRMGMGGRSSVLDVHVEYGVTHTAAAAVAYNAQCSLCRRKVARLTEDGSITVHGSACWDYRRGEGTP